jgi:hypothetical protein
MSTTKKKTGGSIASAAVMKHVPSLDAYNMDRTSRLMPDNQQMFMGGGKGTSNVRRSRSSSGLKKRTTKPFSTLSPPASAKKNTKASPNKKNTKASPNKKKRQSGGSVASQNVMNYLNNLIGGNSGNSKTNNNNGTASGVNSAKKNGSNNVNNNASKSKNSNGSTGSTGNNGAKINVSSNNATKHKNDSKNDKTTAPEVGSKNNATKNAKVNNGTGDVRVSKNAKNAKNTKNDQNAKFANDLQLPNGRPVLENVRLNGRSKNASKQDTSGQTPSNNKTKGGASRSKRTATLKRGGSGDCGASSSSNTDLTLNDLFTPTGNHSANGLPTSAPFGSSSPASLANNGVLGSQGSTMAPRINDVGIFPSEPAPSTGSPFSLTGTPLTGPISPNFDAVPNGVNYTPGL